jgi:hypothetical protein
MLNSIQSGIGQAGSAVGSLAISSIAPIAIFVLPFSLSVSAYTAIANKDTVQNYTLLSLIFFGSYLTGLIGYVLLLILYPLQDERMTLMYTVLFVIMFCFAITVAAGGVASLALDANTTVNVK